MKYSFTKRQAFSVITIFCLILSACQKDNPTNSDNAPPRLAKIIDWEAANANKDTVPEFTVQYTNNKITALTGKYGEQMTFKYDLNPDGLSHYYDYKTQSRIIRTHKLFLELPVSIDTLEFKSNSFDTIQGVALTGTPMRVFFQEQDNNTRKFTSPFNGYYSGGVDVNYNASGDVSLINYQRQWENNLEKHIVEVNYTGEENTLNKVYKRLDVIDPSALNSLIDLLSPGKNANYYPFSIHYGSKCIASFTITSIMYYNGSEISRNELTHAVSYQFNDDGYITKILIDNAPFKEFIYSNN